jgi:hypothetical protein
MCLRKGCNSQVRPRHRFISFAYGLEAALLPGFGAVDGEQCGVLVWAQRKDQWSLTHRFTMQHNGNSAGVESFGVCAVSYVKTRSRNTHSYVFP